MPASKVCSGGLADHWKFLTIGFYNEMKLDLFETLSPPTVGNVDLEHARKILDAKRGSKHMVAASDYLFYDIQLENVMTLVNTVKQYKY